MRHRGSGCLLAELPHRQRGRWRTQQRRHPSVGSEGQRLRLCRVHFYVWFYKNISKLQFFSDVLMYLLSEIVSCTGILHFHSTVNFYEITQSHRVWCHSGSWLQGKRNAACECEFAFFHFILIKIPWSLKKKTELSESDTFFWLHKKAMTPEMATSLRVYHYGNSRTQASLPICSSVLFTLED